MSWAILQIVAVMTGLLAVGVIFELVGRADRDPAVPDNPTNGEIEVALAEVDEQSPPERFHNRIRR